MERIEQIIARAVRDKGGRAFYVGGCVRDKLLGLPCKDIDIEVHGIVPNECLEILKRLGEPAVFGNSFGIYSLKGQKVDIALPRQEHAVGKGHKDFEVLVDPFIGTTEAARRRDFTVNAIMEDVLTGEIIDPFNGREDLKKGLLRHIDDQKFIEDPLRVFRAAQFASRFEFSLDPSTIRLCRMIDVSVLSRERVEGELKKALLKGKKPSVFFETLRIINQLSDWFPELEQLIDLEQDKIFHPEGDVWTHTMQVIDRATAFADKVDNPYGFLLLCLTHDFGKIVATEKQNGRIHAYGHEIKGLPLVEMFLSRFCEEKEIHHYILNMVPLHMKPNISAYAGSSLKKTNRMFDAACAPQDLVYFALCDKPLVGDEDQKRSDYLFQRYEEYVKIIAKPAVTGKDLIDAGLTPGVSFSEMLDYAHKLHLAGIEKEAALKQTLAYARQKFRR